MGKGNFTEDFRLDGHRQVNGTDCAMKRMAKGAEFMRRGERW